MYTYFKFHLIMEIFFRNIYKQVSFYLTSDKDVNLY